MGSTYVQSSLFLLILYLHILKLLHFLLTLQLAMILPSFPFFNHSFILCLSCSPPLCYCSHVFLVTLSLPIPLLLSRLLWWAQPWKVLKPEKSVSSSILCLNLSIRRFILSVQSPTRTIPKTTTSGLIICKILTFFFPVSVGLMQRAIIFYEQAALCIQSWQNDRIFLIRLESCWRYNFLFLEYDNCPMFLEYV